MKLIRKWFYRTGNILKFKPAITTLQHDTRDITIKTLAEGRDIHLDSRRQIYQMIGGSGNVVTRADTDGFHVNKDLLPITNGGLNVGNSTHKFKGVHLKHSIFSPLQFTVSAVETDFTAESLTITLPHAVPSDDYMVVMEIDAGGFANLGKIKLVNGSRSITEFQIMGYDYSGNFLNCTGNPTDLKFMLFFPNG